MDAGRLVPKPHGVGALWHDQHHVPYFGPDGMSTNPDVCHDGIADAPNTHVPRSFKSTSLGGARPSPCLRATLVAGVALPAGIGRWLSYASALLRA